MTSSLMFCVVCACTMQYSYNNQNVQISPVCFLQGEQSERPSRRAGIALGTRCQSVPELDRAPESPTTFPVEVHGGNKEISCPARCSLQRGSTADGDSTWCRNAVDNCQLNLSRGCWLSGGDLNPSPHEYKS